MKKLIFIVLFLVIANFAFSTELTGKVVKVIDGDSITILCDKNMVSIRLADIDCPEWGQPFGKSAKRYTSKLAVHKIVTVHVKEEDKYGRTVGTVILPDGINLNRELVKAGLAWWFRKYSDDKSYEELEKEAREAKRGLWSTANPTTP